MSLRITITNNKGGVAKTSTCVNTAAALAALGLKVLVVDTDPQGGATLHLGVREQVLQNQLHLTKAIEGKQAIRELIVPTNIAGVSLLASHPSLMDIPVRYSAFKTQFELFRQALGTPENDQVSQYDFVLFDTSPALNCLLASALDVSHYYLIPIFAEIEPIVGLVQLREWLERTAMSAAQKVSLLGLLIANFDKNNATHRQMVEFLNTNVGTQTRIFQTRIPSSNAVKAAALQAIPLLSLRNGTSPAAVAYSHFVAELIEVLAQEGALTLGQR